jgi:hypothetical protein
VNREPKKSKEQNIMQTKTETLSFDENIAAGTRRGLRIAAFRARRPIPWPETAVADHEARNSEDDQMLLAVLRGQATVAATFPPARLLPHATVLDGTGNERSMANEEFCFAIGPTVRYA